MKTRHYSVYVKSETEKIMPKDKEKNEPKTLDEVLSQIRKDYGDGAIQQGGGVIVKGVQSIPTGSIALDSALGVGGIPRGRITEVFGPEASGKTTLCLEIAANTQRAGGKVAFIDAEHALDLNYTKNGIGIDTDAWFLSQPDSGEEALTICERLAKSGAISLIVIDSVAALMPQAVLDGAMGDANPGAQARLMSKALGRLKGIVNKTNTAVIFVNQIREKIGIMFGSSETTSGGRALKFYASVRIDIRRLESVKGGEEGPTGNKIRARVVKNKVASPFREAEFEITYGKGINKLGSLIDVAESVNIIKKAGSFFKYAEKSFLGREKLMDWLTSNPTAMQTLDSTVRDQLKLKPAKEVAEELQAAEDTLTVESDN